MSAATDAAYEKGVRASAAHIEGHEPIEVYDLIRDDLATEDERLAFDRGWDFAIALLIPHDDV